MKKIEPKDQILYVRVTKSVKDFVTKKALERFGVKRRESFLVNEVFEELRDYSQVNISRNKSET